MVTAALGGDGIAEVQVSVPNGIASLTIGGVELIDADGNLIEGVSVTTPDGSVRTTFLSMEYDESTDIYTFTYQAELLEPVDHSAGDVEITLPVVLTDNAGLQLVTDGYVQRLSTTRPRPRTTRQPPRKASRY